MELLLVHLTDIHIRDDEDLDVLSARTDSIGGAICNHITNPDETEVVFCVTGDLAFSGKDDQYVAAGLILDEIYSLINKRYPKVGIHSVFVPGIMIVILMLLKKKLENRCLYLQHWI